MNNFNFTSILKTCPTKQEIASHQDEALTVYNGIEENVKTIIDNKDEREIIMEISVDVCKDLWLFALVMDLCGKNLLKKYKVIVDYIHSRKLDDGSFSAPSMALVQLDVRVNRLKSELPKIESKYNNLTDKESDKALKMLGKIEKYKKQLERYGNIVY